MRGLVLVAILVSACCGSPILDASLDTEWDAFKLNFGKSYDGLSEEVARRLNWEGHRAFIAKHNKEYDAGLHTFYVGENEYCDMSVEEFAATMNGLKFDPTAKSNSTVLPELIGAPLAATVDWRKKGVVTGVKNQGRCGSCWAFSTTGSLEGQHAIKTGQLVSLSEQNLVDCSRSNAGCRGGLMDKAFQDIQREGGIDTESSYAYRGVQGQCQFSRAHVGATDFGYSDVPRGSESALMNAVGSRGPVSVGIDANHQSFMTYRGGIFNEPACSSTQLDHGVLVVGYGPGYWLVKNSWGTSWGEQGYVRMSKDRQNQCGIATSASLPKV